MDKKFKNLFSEKSSRRKFVEKSLGLTTMGLFSGVIPSSSVAQSLDRIMDLSSDRWKFSEGFSGQQGKNNWSFLEWDGKKYIPMTWSGEEELWRGSEPSCMISKDWLHPGNNDAVLRWEAPKSGSVCVKGNVKRGVVIGDEKGETVRRRVEYRGDGIRFKILKNKNQSWPSTGWQEMEIGTYMGSFEQPHKEYVYGGCSVKHVQILEVKKGDQLYFHVNKNHTSDFDRVEWDPQITYGEKPWYTTDKSEIVMRPDDLKRNGIHTFDGSFGVLPAEDDEFYWWMSEWNGTLHYKMKGPLDNPSKELVFRKDEKDFWEGFDLPKGHAWIQNLYEDKKRGNILAFLHYEHVEPDNYKIGLAVSKDGGNTFKLLGYTVESEDDVTSDGSLGNMLGCPYFIREGYFYVYYGDHGTTEGVRLERPAVVRAPVEEVLEAADQYRLSPWKKYYNGLWEEDALGGKATQLFDSRLMVHGDAAHSSQTGEYYLSGYGQGNKEQGVFLGRSKDGVNWEHTWLVDNSYMTVLCPYITIVNEDGTDNGEIGKAFYVYWTFGNGWTNEEYLTPRINYGLQTMYRQKVILT